MVNSCRKQQVAVVPPAQKFMYKIYLEDGGNIQAGRMHVQPNPHGGIRKLRLWNIDMLWTGRQHLYVQGDVELQICDARGIYWRSTLDETDEPWTLISPCLAAKAGMFYPTWEDTAKVVEDFVASH